MSDDLISIEIVEPKPVCHVCGKPATCIGSYEMSEVDFACDECCGHGCEDGWCQQINADSWLVGVTIERNALRIAAQFIQAAIEAIEMTLRV